MVSLFHVTIVDISIKPDAIPLLHSYAFSIICEFKKLTIENDVAFLLICLNSMFLTQMWNPYKSRMCHHSPIF